MSARKAPKAVVRKEKTLRLNGSAAIASYYGFSSRDIKLPDRESLGKLKKVLDIDPKKDSEIMQTFDTQIYLDEKLVLIEEAVRAESTLSQPLMTFYQKKEVEKRQRLGLEIIGAPRSIAEATLSKASLEILKSEGYEKLYIEINSTGDKD